MTLYMPEWMRDQRRWLVRRIDQKRPLSPLPAKPEGYIPQEPDESPHKWRSRHNQSVIWGTYGQALSLWQRRTDLYEGLNFALHPSPEDRPGEKIICKDYDRAFGPDGQLLEAVREEIDLIGSYTELSRGGGGLHTFELITDCQPFTNLHQRPITKGCCGLPYGAECRCPPAPEEELKKLRCALDLIYAGQVAVTGRVFEDNREVKRVPYFYLPSRPWFQYRPRLEEDREYGEVFAAWWQAPEKPLGPPDQAMLRVCQTWTPGVKGHGRSNVAFALACDILREGYEGWQAVRLLQASPADPPWSEADAKHKIESAYKHVIADGTLGKGRSGFDSLELGPLTAEYPEPTPAPDEEIQVYTVKELIEADLRLEWVVDPLLVAGQPLVVGGTEKTFKTGVTNDLLLSLATETPWLGRFPVRKRKSSLFFTAEIGMEAAQDLLRRQAAFKGLDPREVENMRLTSYLPVVNPRKAQETVAKFQRVLDIYEPEVVAIDPLYLISAEIEAGNPYLLSGILSCLSTVCRNRGIWLVICHHSRKLDEGAPMSLQDLYGAGCGMFFRQWILLSHAQPYALGHADLHMVIGGSATGHRGLWRLQIDEGEADQLVNSRHWRTEVQGSGELSPNQEGTETALSASYILTFYGDEPRTAKQVQGFTGFPMAEIAEITQRLADEGRIRFAGTGFIRVVDHPE